MTGAEEISTVVVLGFSEGQEIEVPVLSNACSETAAVLDADSDGWTSCAGDCDDTEASIHPSVKESANGVDDNCNDVVDEGTPASDDDNDGYTEEGGDCWDGSDTVNPGASELPGNGIDDNCNGLVDE